MSSRSKPSTMQYDHLVKLLLLGDSGVGKSSLLLKYTEDRFDTKIQSTAGVDYKLKMVDLAGCRVKAQIWDTAGQERFGTITQQYYRRAMGIVLVYDCTSAESFENVRRWVAQVAVHGATDVNKMLIANKADDLQHQVVDPEEGRALAEEYGIPFFETSAKDGQNVDGAFFRILDNVRARLQAKEGGPGRAVHSDGIRLGKGRRAGKQTQGCCK